MGDITMSQLASRFAVSADKLNPVSQSKLRILSQLGVGHVKSAIQDVHAVDTGTMLNSTQAEQVSDLTWLIGPTVFYAPYVALGTSRMEARPFHIIAARRLDADAKELFGKTAEDIGL